LRGKKFEQHQKTTRGVKMHFLKEEDRQLFFEEYFSHVKVHAKEVFFSDFLIIKLLHF